MTRPTPTTELVIRQSGEYITVFALSQDAANWVVQELPMYASVCTFTAERMQGFAYIKPNFDPAQVAAHLRSYNEEPTL